MSRRLGGDERVVVVDETYITRKRRSKSFWGRMTQAHTTIILAALEIAPDSDNPGGFKDWNGRVDRACSGNSNTL